jgi:hypothetical protein
MNMNPYLGFRKAVNFKSFFFFNYSEVVQRFKVKKYKEIWCLGKPCQWRRCCNHPRICQKTIKKNKTVSPEPLFHTEYFNRCLSEQLHIQNYSWLEQSTIRCNSDTNHGLLQGSCVEAIWHRNMYTCKWCCF